jgi:hypothetical protein
MKLNIGRDIQGSMANNWLLSYGKVGFGFHTFQDAHDQSRDHGIFFEFECIDQGHISTRQIRRLLEKVLRRQDSRRQGLGMSGIGRGSPRTF